jgi:succinoglycan biosynthesis transport protein ExoP
MDLILLAKVIWRKKWLLLAVPVVAAVAAYLFVFNTVDLYKSTAQISTGFTISDQVQVTEEKFSIRDADVKFSNLLNSMNSSIGVNLITYRLLLHDLKNPESAFKRPNPQTFKSSPDEINIVTTFIQAKLDSMSPLSISDEYYNLTRKYLNAYGYGFNKTKEGLSIQRVAGTDFITVEFVSENPNLSALAANAFCEEYIRYYKSIKTTKVGESVDFLKQIVDEKKIELDEKLETQKIFKSGNGIIEGHDGTQLSSLELQRDEIRSKVHRLELTRDRLGDEIRNWNNPNAVSAISNASNQKIVALREKVNRLNDQYITGGATNQVLLDSVTRLRNQLNILMENASSRQVAAPSSGLSLPELQSKLKDAEIEYQVEKTNLSMVEAKIRSLQYMLSGQSSKEAKLEAVQKEVDLASQEYLSATEKYNDAKNRLLANNTLRQVSTALPALNAESSKKILVIGLAAFSTFAICLFIVIGLEMIDLSIKTFDKFKRIVGLELAGTLNKIDSKNFNIRSIFSQTGSDDETEMYKSLLRKLRHEIESMNAKVFLITSPRKKDGKTFSVFSLAYVLSLVNKRVLIIDTNFKNNSLSQILAKPESDMKVIEGSKRKNLLIGTPGQKKKSSRPDFANDSDSDDDFEGDNTYDLINPTKYKNIYIVGNGGGDSESPAEILSGRNFDNLIAVLAESFDYILMEGAALNDFSDTKELVKYADKVLAVFSAESTIKQLDRESIAYFKSIGKKFGGCILNKVETKDLKL